MPAGLKRFYVNGDLHFITASCYRRQPLLGAEYRKDLFVKVLEQVRQRYDFVVVGYVVMPEHFHLLRAKIAILSQVAKAVLDGIIACLVGGGMGSGMMQTVQQVADFLQVPQDAIESEIKNGRLQAVRIGSYFRISEAALNDFLNRASTTTVQPTKPVAEQESNIRLQQAPNFFHIWPDKKKEKFVDVQDGVAEYLRANYQVRVGFTIRHSAGKDRRRSLVIINRYPTVEFVSADANAGGKMASIIRDRAGKQLPVGANLPPEYAGLPVGPYKDVVVGPGTSNGMAVICDGDEINIMVRHALIRFRYRQEKQA